MTRWAVFDVDGTLLPGTSMEMSFIRHLICKKNLPFPNLVSYLAHIPLIWFNSGRLEALLNNKYYLKGLPAAVVENAGAKFIHDSIIQKLASRGLYELTRSRQEGYRILIMSGSPYFLTSELASELQADHLITMYLEVNRGSFTGKLEGLHPLGLRKKLLLQKARSLLDIDYTESVVYANHHYDQFHMELFGRAVAVNPTKRLKKIAVKKAWEIQSWV
ncbi:haloacid dehalogenase-like hydrolase [bacterium]|nr:haloacid dehalogenase-like hydrolase [bacterium]